MHVLPNMNYLEVMRLSANRIAASLSLTVDCHREEAAENNVNTNDMLYFITWATWSLTFPVIFSLFLPSTSSSASLGTPALTKSIWLSNRFFFIVLISHSLWITHVCCVKCHRSMLYEITMQFISWVSPLSRLFFPAALFDACIEKPYDINAFCFPAQILVASQNPPDSVLFRHCWKERQLVCVKQMVINSCLMTWYWKRVTGQQQHFHSLYFLLYVFPIAYTVVSSCSRPRRRRPLHANIPRKKPV